MKFLPAPADLVERFGRALPSDPRVERRKMFSYPCAFVNGNMVGGLFQDRVMMRLPPGEAARLLGRDWVRFEPMPGRPMGGYVEAPKGVAGDAEKLRGYLRAAVDYTASLPPKQKKDAKQKASRAPVRGPRSGARKKPRSR